MRTILALLLMSSIAAAAGNRACPYGLKNGTTVSITGEVRRGFEHFEIIPDSCPERRIGVIVSDTVPSGEYRKLNEYLNDTHRVPEKLGSPCDVACNIPNKEVRATLKGKIVKLKPNTEVYTVNIRVEKVTRVTATPINKE